ncbi:MAG TPA: SGNH/GDSL hydrolase family protein, partial [Polyangiaceae bacterium]|nr:SGNH/GDSL hydrolase family protein [Polyangiaceae bacterium]
EGGGASGTSPSAEPDVAGAKSAAAAGSAQVPSGTKVLHVGDSFAGALGVPLGKRLEEHGVHSILKHIDASYLTTWAWQQDLDRMVWKYNPDLVVITLGANELAIVEPEQRSRAIHKIVESLGGRPCVWVGIPLWNGPGNGLLDVIARESRPCSYLDTNALMDTAHMARISDGIHPTSSAREQWAGVVFDWLAAQRDPRGARPWELRSGS